MPEVASSWSELFQNPAGKAIGNGYLRGEIGDQEIEEIGIAGRGRKVYHPVAGLILF
jgi:hypothetical protein